MTRFLSCIDNLQRQCENAQEAEVLLQIINPERVRTSVPNLCGNIDCKYVYVIGSNAIFIIYHNISHRNHKGIGVS